MRFRRLLVYFVTFVICLPSINISVAANDTYIFEWNNEGDNALNWVGGTKPAKVEDGVDDVGGAYLSFIRNEAWDVRSSKLEVTDTVDTDILDISYEFYQPSDKMPNPDKGFSLRFLFDDGSYIYSYFDNYGSGCVTLSYDLGTEGNIQMVKDTASLNDVWHALNFQIDFANKEVKYQYQNLKTEAKKDGAITISKDLTKLVSILATFPNTGKANNVNEEYRVRNLNIKRITPPAPALEVFAKNIINGEVGTNEEYIELEFSSDISDIYEYAIENAVVVETEDGTGTDASVSMGEDERTVLVDIRSLQKNVEYILKIFADIPISELLLAEDFEVPFIIKSQESISYVIWDENGDNASLWSKVDSNSYEAGTVQDVLGDDGKYYLSVMRGGAWNRRSIGINIHDMEDSRPLVMEFDMYMSSEEIYKYKNNYESHIVFSFNDGSYVQIGNDAYNGFKIDHSVGNKGTVVLSQLKDAYDIWHSFRFTLDSEAGVLKYYHTNNDTGVKTNGEIELNSSVKSLEKFVVRFANSGQQENASQEYRIKNLNIQRGVINVSDVNFSLSEPADKNNMLVTFSQKVLPENIRDALIIMDEDGNAVSCNKYVSRTNDDKTIQIRLDGLASDKIYKLVLEAGLEAENGAILQDLYSVEFTVSDGDTTDFVVENGEDILNIGAWQISGKGEKSISVSGNETELTSHLQSGEKSVFTYELKDIVGDAGLDVSFDAKINSNGGCSDWNSALPEFVLDNGLSIRVYRRSDNTLGWAGINGSEYYFVSNLNVDASEYHNLRMIFDFNMQKVSLYLDGEFVEVRDILNNGNLPKSNYVKALRTVMNSSDSGVEQVFIKNLYAERIANVGVFLSDDSQAVNPFENVKFEFNTQVLLDTWNKFSKTIKIMEDGQEIRNSYECILAENNTSFEVKVNGYLKYNAKYTLTAANELVNEIGTKAEHSYEINFETALLEEVSANVRNITCKASNEFGNCKIKDATKLNIEYSISNPGSKEVQPVVFILVVEPNGKVVYSKTISYELIGASQELNDCKVDISGLKNNEKSVKIVAVDKLKNYSALHDSIEIKD